MPLAQFHRPAAAAPHLTRSPGRYHVRSSGLNVRAGVFVDCGYGGSYEAEATSVLAMVDDPDSLIAGLVAHIPAPDGGESGVLFAKVGRGPPLCGVVRCVAQRLRCTSPSTYTKC